MNPPVAVVIPTHRRPALLASCIASVAASEYRNIRIIVVNDGGGEETTRLLAERFPSVIELRSSRDLWWAGAMNEGLRAARKVAAGFCLVLNDDVTVHPAAIGALVAKADANRGAIVCSVIVAAGAEDRVWAAGGGVSWPFRGEFHHVGVRRSGASGQSVVVDWSPGMGTLIPMSVVERIGDYDEKNMPQYLADADLCLRAKRAGFVTLLCPESIIYNRVEMTGGIGSDGAISLGDALWVFTNIRSSEFVRARLTFMFRHCPLPLLVPAVGYRYGRLLAHLARRLLSRAGSAGAR